MPEPTILLLSTSDTDLITARACGARYRWANPSRLIEGELTDLLAGADLVVVRILGGYRSWQDGIDTVVRSGVPTVIVSGEQRSDGVNSAAKVVSGAASSSAVRGSAGAGLSDAAQAARSEAAAAIPQPPRSQGLIRRWCPCTAGRGRPGRS